MSESPDEISAATEGDGFGEPPSVLAAGLRGVCPRCGKGNLLKGALSVQSSCHVCGLSFSNHENGDGPAFFAVGIVSIVVAVAAALTEIFLAPPYWLHAVLWLPLIALLSFFVLRWAKGIIIALQYKHQADTFHDA